MPHSVYQTFDLMYVRSSTKFHAVLRQKYIDQ